MNAYNIITVLGLISYFVPILILGFKKIWRRSPFLLFALYWVIGGLINLSDYIPGISGRQMEVIAVLYNIVDFPLILFILFQSTRHPLARKLIVMAMLVLCLVLIFSPGKPGIYYESVQYYLAAGLFAVVAVLIILILAYIQKVHHSNTEFALIFIYSGLLFEYGTFVVNYIFDYYMRESSSQDNYLIYYLSTLIAVMVASYGLISVKRPSTGPGYSKIA